MVALTLPRLHWGPKDSEHTALIVHGLGSSAATTWQLSEALSEAGWSATAVDLRGHGLAPRGTSYRIDDFAEDLASTTPEGGGSWGVVIGHSIGAASAVVAAHHNPTWTTRLILLDPALELGDATREQVLENQRQGHLHQGVEDIRGANPHWHPLDVELKVQAHRQASLFALEHAVFDNDPWNITQEATAISTPTHVIGADPAEGSMFCNDYAKWMVEANPQMTYEVIEGAGHSVHRDKPAETLQAILRYLG
ncbi:MAG TPA: alpha/beta hydrolase [Pontimonas sp.]|nr:alpha/beta hydrolase [Pontimonas sp.]